MNKKLKEILQELEQDIEHLSNWVQFTKMDLENLEILLLSTTKGDEVSPVGQENSGSVS